MNIDALTIRMNKAMNKAGVTGDVRLGLLTGGKDIEVSVPSPAPHGSADYKLAARAGAWVQKATGLKVHVRHTSECGHTNDLGTSYCWFCSCG